MTMTQDRPSEAVRRPQRVWSWVGWNLLELAGIAAILLLALTVWGPLGWLAPVGVVWLLLKPVVRTRAKTRPERSGRHVTDPAVWWR